MKDLAGIIWDNVRACVEQRTTKTALLLNYFREQPEKILKEYETYLSKCRDELIEQFGAIDEDVLQNFYEKQRKRLRE